MGIEQGGRGLISIGKYEIIERENIVEYLQSSTKQLLKPVTKGPVMKRVIEEKTRRKYKKSMSDILQRNSCLTYFGDPLKLNVAQNSELE